MQRAQFDGVFHNRASWLCSANALRRLHHCLAFKHVCKACQNSLTHAPHRQPLQLCFLWVSFSCADCLLVWQCIVQVLVSSPFTESPLCFSPSFSLAERRLWRGAGCGRQCYLTHRTWRAKPSRLREPAREVECQLTRMRQQSAHCCCYHQLCWGSSSLLSGWLLVCWLASSLDGI